MGCISSKIMTRSTSFQEELSRSLHRRNKGFPGLEELIFVSKNGDDIVSTANSSTVPEKPQSVTHPITNTRPSGEPTRHHIINSWELMEGLEEYNQQEPINAMQRSKSLNGSSNFKSSLDSSFDGITTSCSENGNVGRCRSFHTIEEYNTMVERNQLFKEKGESRTRLSLEVETACKVEEDRRDFKLTDNSNNIGKKHGVEEKGVKRKALAKQLTSLKVPYSTVDFPAIGSSTEVEGQVSILGDYVTPKFGSFASIPAVSLKKDKCNVFDPEMMFAFEEAMQQLEQEEEVLLQQISADSNANKNDQEVSAQVLL
ncbi:hypothetical protein GIB67_033338 [Kingdonia uniflora]|uniref:Uncharacterized protein n=1 Tax=Kingdonia uniflora TaxID=39325 RepID=A0A7J7LTR4_9MAGN|nr:hypothetical protein GIB67_033338 [Kingdonia uniflora]